MKKIEDILGNDFLAEDLNNLLSESMIVESETLSKKEIEDILLRAGLEPYTTYDCLLCKADLMTVCKLAWSYAIEIGTRRCHGMELPCVTIIKIESHD